jgi:hypothetical protein
MRVLRDVDASFLGQKCSTIRCSTQLELFGADWSDGATQAQNKWAMRCVLRDADAWRFLVKNVVPMRHALLECSGRRARPFCNPSRCPSSLARTTRPSSQSCLARAVMVIFAMGDVEVPNPCIVEDLKPSIRPSGPREDRQLSTSAGLIDCYKRHRMSVTKGQQIQQAPSGSRQLTRSRCTVK